MGPMGPTGPMPPPKGAMDAMGPIRRMGPVGPHELLEVCVLQGLLRTVALILRHRDVNLSGLGESRVS